MATKNRKRSKGTELQTRPNALESSPLRRLPDRVILHIAKFLSPASKFAFGRCCRHLYSVTGIRHLTPAGEARKPAWEVLELEHPDHLECYYCRDLHPIDKIHEYAYLEAKTNTCLKMDHPVRTARFIHPNFRFTVFRMVMKQYRQGKDCDKLLEFLAYRSGAVMEGAQVKQVIATPKIVGERLLMRLQSAYVVPPKGPSRRYLVTRNLMKCPHKDKWSHRNRIVTERLFQRFAALETVSKGCQEHIISSRCNFCPTEFHFGLQQFEGQGVVLFITKWQDLGTGLSPLASDLPPVVGCRQKIHIVQRGERLVYESPRDRFEGLTPGEGFQAISALNCEGRNDLFRMSDSRLAQFRRLRDSACWSIHGYGQPWPYNTAPKLVKRSEQILAIARFMEAAESKVNSTAFG